MDNFDSVFAQIGFVPQNLDKITVRKNWYEADFEEDPIILKEVIDKSVCSDCGIPLTKNMGVYYCEGCGREEEAFDSEVPIEGNSEYNTSHDSAAPVRISGPGSYQYQKKLISSTSDYKKQQYKNTHNEMKNIVMQYAGCTVPPDVIKEASNMYYRIQQSRILRADVRKGTMAACLYKSCQRLDTVRKHKQIAEMFGIQQKDVSTGEKIIDSIIASADLRKEGDQFCFNENKQIDSFLNRFFESLNIPEVHKEFCRSLIRFTIKYRIAENTVISTKCAGVIYILAKKLDMDISREDIERNCEISKSTFARFQQSVYAEMYGKDPHKEKLRSRLIHIFKKAKIPWQQE